MQANASECEPGQLVPIFTLHIAVLVARCHQSPASPWICATLRYPTLQRRQHAASLRDKLKLSSESRWRINPMAISVAG
jgi:hypothetical protein